MTTVKELFSPDQQNKAEIVKYSDGLFEVDVFIWDEEWQCWLQVSRGFSLTDTVESSIQIGIEKLRNCYGKQEFSKETPLL